MIYRYFECEAGHTFNTFVEPSALDTTTNKYKTTCECGKPATSCWNDPNAPGTKLLFNYMER